MGVQSDHEILLLVAGTDMVYQDTFSINFEECSKLKVFTQQQALDYLGVRIKKTRATMAAKRTPAREAMEALATIVLAHVPVENLNFRPKALYMAFMTRRVIQAMVNPELVDDRDYVGNKRLELYVHLISLLHTFTDRISGLVNCCRCCLKICLRSSTPI